MIPLPFPGISLFFDVDGTLIDIAERPEAVVVPARLLASLSRAQSLLGGALALVSGRAIGNLDHLFRPLQLAASGVHGAEFRLQAGAAIIEAASPLPPSVVAGVRAIAAEHPGSFVEDKRFSAALHYRQAADAAPAIRQALDQLLARHEGDQLRMLPGHMVFDIKGAAFDKGKAIRRFMGEAPFQGRVPVFLGDDVTDRPGFEAAIEAGGYAFSVGQAYPGVTDVFANPESVRNWLSGLVEPGTA